MSDVVDSGVEVVAGGRFELDNTLTVDGDTYDLTDKTVTATIRRERDQQRVLHEDFEDMAVTIVSETDGTVQLQVTSEQSAELAPIAASEAYVVQYKVVDDEYYPQRLRFKARWLLD